jgi:hypothetical protein
MRRRFFTLCSALSLLMCVAVCVLWVRGRTGTDTAAWTFDRWLPDGSAASNQVHITCDHRIWLSVNWGRVGPPTGQLVWGYYVNADASGGRPRFWFHRDLYDPMWTWALANAADNTSGFGPLRWDSHSRNNPAAGERFRSIRVGASHWLLALILLAAPTLWLIRFRNARRDRKVGLCAACGYDLRATPQAGGPLLDRCPECGLKPQPVHDANHV